MADSVGDLADKIYAIKERAERVSKFRESLLANPEKLLSEQGVAMNNIANVSAEYHNGYNVAILITFKVSPSFTPALKPSDDQNKQNYDFLDCHNF